jgi:hypothetical protein
MTRLSKRKTLLLVAGLAVGAVTACSKIDNAKSDSASVEGAINAAAAATPARPAPSASLPAHGTTSGACFACENDPAKCQDFVDCNSLAGNAAAESPAAGSAKSALCNEVLDCVRTTGCAVGNGIIKCYCGTANAQDCQSGHANGACKKQLERGLEGTTFLHLARHLKDPKLGGGMAMARVDCEQQVCRAQCGL